MSEFATYQQFFNQEEAEGIISILTENDIPWKFNKSAFQVDKMIVGDANKEVYELSIPTIEFERATALILANSRINLEELDKDYYLFSFSEEELHDILANPDEWSRLDYLIALELLKLRVAG